MKTTFVIVLIIMLAWIVFRDGRHIDWKTGNARSSVRDIVVGVAVYCEERNGISDLLSNQSLGVQQADEIVAILSLNASDEILAKKNPERRRYLDWNAGLKAGLKDPWAESFMIGWCQDVVSEKGQSKSEIYTFLVWSKGPNRINEFGKGDDVSSIKIMSLSSGAMHGGVSGRANP